MAGVGSGQQTGGYQAGTGYQGGTQGTSGGSVERPTGFQGSQYPGGQQGESGGQQTGNNEQDFEKRQGGYGSGMTNSPQ